LTGGSQSVTAQATFAIGSNGGFASLAGFEIVNTGPGGFGNLPISTPLSISNGATLDMTNYIQTVLSLSSTDGRGSQVLLGGGALTITGTAATTFDGTISGAGGSLTLEAGALTLTGTNTFTGGTTVGGAKLIVTNVEALEDGSSLYIGNAFADGSSPFGAIVPAVAPASATVMPVPEPWTLALVATAAVLAAGVWRRKAGRFSRKGSVGVH
jgi:hypothetical protein